MQSSYLVQELSVLCTATQEHVLPVVYLDTTLAVCEGESPPPQVWPSLYQSHIVAQAGETPCRSHTGQSPAQYNDVAHVPRRAGRRLAAHSLAVSRTFSAVVSLTRPWKTSKRRASIRSSSREYSP